MRRLMIAAKHLALFLNGLVAVAEYLLHAAHPRPGLIVLLYHRLASDLPRWPPFDAFNVEPRTFERQLDELARMRDVALVSVRDIAGWVDTGGPRNGSYVAMTFDDGWHHLVEQLSTPAARGVPITVFVSTAHLGRPLLEFFRFDRWHVPTAHDRAKVLTPLDLADCRALVAAGVDVQPHGHTHRSLGNLPDAEMRAEIAQSVGVMEQELGVRAIAFAYPYGTSRFADCTPRVEMALADRGIRIALRSDPGLNRLDALCEQALRLRRVAVTEFDVGLILRAKASGYLGFLPFLASRSQALRSSAGLAPSAR
jgi:peptidoglycan/xylan/chitin deacetylase (PgdA/CDA1 family)